MDAPVRVLGIAASPRRGGNTETLLEALLEGARRAGAETTKLALSDLHYQGCRACGGCAHTGQCVLQDDLVEVYGLLRSHNRLVLAAPIFFMGLCSQAKMLIDRAQATWVLTQRLGLPFAGGEDRRGMLISCGGSEVRDLFAGAVRTFRAFLRTIEMEYAGCLCVGGLDAAGEAQRDAALLERARSAGVNLVS